MKTTIMKMKDIVVEHRRGKKPDHAKNADTGEWQFRDQGVDRVYNLNRIMMASAMHDGQGNHAVEMDEASWVEKNNVARPYTEAEHNMMKGAFKTVKSEYKHSSSDHKSREQDDVHKVSPVGRTGPIKRKS
jgi:hypothetical protein